MLNRTLLALALLSPLLMGAAPTNEPKYVARAASLNPAPITEIPQVAPIIKTEVIPYSPPKVAQNEAPAPVQGGSDIGGLVGSIGYAKASGNCVNEPGLNKQNGNPISWTVLSTTPTIGATALWTYNHTGVVTGLWSNGDVEVRHQNYKGGQHRFPRSAFRGFR